jgi:RNA polymerase sigma factor (sigma-70 family)
LKIDIPYIKSALRKYTTDTYLIEELASKVSIKLFERDYNCQTQEQYKKLIRLIIRSAFIDYYRSAKSNKINIEELNDKLKVEDKSIDTEAIFKGIDKLNENQKDVILLRYFFNMNFEQICKLMQIKYNTALSYAHNAKHNLRQFLTKEQVYEY